MLPVIGVAGKARAGKDTVAKAIVQLRGGYRYAFADPIKGMTKALGIDAKKIEKDGTKEDIIPWLGKSPRYLWQTLGTEWGRTLIHPDLWLLVAGQRLHRDGPGMVISDVRFENEATWVRAAGGRIIHVTRPEATGEVGVAGHKSEKGIEVKYGDIELHNHGSLHQLNNTVHQLLKIISDIDG